MNKYLEKVNSPIDLKKLSLTELSAYSEEVREYIIKVVAENGGHLSSNLGAVDFTIALHYVFDCPKDKFIFDVGHQSYAHKIITGRRDAFVNLRREGGISGFENMKESECDAFSTGHSSTSLSVGLGLARARDLSGENFEVISVIGDGALTGGMAYEALNDIGASKTKMLVVLNDNEMSISKNVGAISSYLGKLRLSKSYISWKNKLKTGLKGVPFFGKSLVSLSEKTKVLIKKQFLPSKMFEQLGFKYYGPYDGHDIVSIVGMLNQVKNVDAPVILHLVTKKGNGLYEAEINPEKYHGVDGKAQCKNKYSTVAGNTLIEMCKSDDKVLGITAAMLCGTGLKALKDTFPEKCLDVGIAEQHATAMSAGLASAGYKPFFAVYSTFLQRAYDQVLHDVCLNNLPVRFLLDRAGVSGSDGATHQGLYDLAYLTSLPNMKVFAPSCGEELSRVLEWSRNIDFPLAIRYPKEYGTDYHVDEIVLGKWSNVKKSPVKAYVLAVGNRMIDIASVVDCNLINARFVKPLDVEYLDSINESENLIITLEDGVVRGGFGESVLAYYNAKGKKCKVVNLGFKDEVCDNLSVKSSFEMNGLTAEHIKEIIKSELKSLE